MMNFKKIMRCMLGLICCLSLMSCGKDLLPGDYDSAEVGKVKKVVPGTVVSIRPVRLHNKMGEGLAGQTGFSSDSSYADNGLNRSHGYEYVIKLNSGSIISVVQAENIKLKNKQRVLVIYGANTRVVPDRGISDE